jgi:hypothetical protein
MIVTSKFENYDYNIEFNAKEYFEDLVNCMQIVYDQAESVPVKFSYLIKRIEHLMKSDYIQEREDDTFVLCTLIQAHMLTRKLQSDNIIVDKDKKGKLEIILH